MCRTGEVNQLRFNPSATLLCGSGAGGNVFLWIVGGGAQKWLHATDLLGSWNDMPRQSVIGTNFSLILGTGLW